MALDTSDVSAIDMDADRRPVRVVIGDFMHIMRSGRDRAHLSGQEQRALATPITAIGLFEIMRVDFLTPQHADQSPCHVIMHGRPLPGSPHETHHRKPL